MVDRRSGCVTCGRLLASLLVFFVLLAFGCKEASGGPCFQDNECTTGLICCEPSQSNRGTCSTEADCEARPPVLMGCGFEPAEGRTFRLESVELATPGLFEKTMIADAGSEEEELDCTGQVTSTLNDYLRTVLCDDQDENGVLDQSVALEFDSTQRTTSGQTEAGLFGSAVCVPAQGRLVECTAVDGPDGGLSGVSDVDFTIQYSGACIARVGLHEVNLSADQSMGCFKSTVVDELIVPFGGLDIPLTNATIMGSLVGRPSEVLEVQDGAILGSITPEIAATVILPAELPEPFGGAPLIDFLRRRPECELSDLENVDFIEAFVFVFEFEGVGVLSSLLD